MSNFGGDVRLCVCWPVGIGFMFFSFTIDIVL